MKEGDKDINLSSIVKSLFRVSTPKIWTLVCLALDERFVIVFSHIFVIHRGCSKGLEDETYPAIDSSVNGESDGVSSSR